jgi:hypothetical protein
VSTKCCQKKSKGLTLQSCKPHDDSSRQLIFWDSGFLRYCDPITHFGVQQHRERERAKKSYNAVALRERTVSTSCRIDEGHGYSLIDCHSRISKLPRAGITVHKVWHDAQRLSLRAITPSNSHSRKLSGPPPFHLSLTPYGISSSATGFSSHIGKLFYIV